ncbi:MAG: hypothetical protein J7M09_01790 [Deltaproteobacteria bacterium]|nr:hypothetical protein [Candidatus Tharpella sp.]
MGLDSIGFDKTLFVISKVSDQLADATKTEAWAPFASWLTDCNVGGWLMGRDVEI